MRETRIAQSSKANPISGIIANRSSLAHRLLRIDVVGQYPRIRNSDLIALKPSSGQPGIEQEELRLSCESIGIDICLPTSCLSYPRGHRDATRTLAAVLSRGVKAMNETKSPYPDSRLQNSSLIGELTQNRGNESKLVVRYHRMFPTRGPSPTLALNDGVVCLQSSKLQWGFFSLSQKTKTNWLATLGEGERRKRRRDPADDFHCTMAVSCFLWSCVLFSSCFFQQRLLWEGFRSLDLRRRRKGTRRVKFSSMLPRRHAI